MKISAPFLVLLFVLGFITLPSQAQEKPITPSVFRQNTPPLEKITVYGRVFTIKPFQASDSDTTWADVKKTLPTELFQAAEKTLTNAEILARVDALAKQRGQAYEQAIRAEVAKQMKAQPPSIDERRLELEIAGILSTQKGPQKYPELQQRYNAYIALSYLQEMLRYSMGLGLPLL